MDALPSSHPRLDITASSPPTWLSPVNASPRTASPPSPSPTPVAARSFTPDGFVALYRANYHRLRRIAGRISGSEAIAEESVQEAFARAAARWETLSRLDNPAAWLCRVTVNIAIDERRRGHTEGRVFDRLSVEHTTARHHVEQPDSDPELLAALRQLPPRQLTAIVLVYLEDCSPEDAAALMRCSYSTLRTHLERGRRALLEILTGGDASASGNQGRAR